MRKTIPAVLSAVILLALLTASGAAGVCNPDGLCPFTGCLGWFDWTSNPSFYNGASCWTLYGNATVKNDGLMCTPRPYVEFGLFGFGASTLQQVVHIAKAGEPNYQPSNHFEFDYSVQFVDPHHDAWNIISIGLYDNSNNALLQWITSITGAQANPNCGGYLDFHNSALVGKNVRIDVQARSIYSDTKIRITGLALWQIP